MSASTYILVSHLFIFSRSFLLSLYESPVIVLLRVDGSYGHEPFFEALLVAILLREVFVGVFVIIYRHPLAETCVSHFVFHFRYVLCVDVCPVVEFLSRRQEICRLAAKQSAEAVGCGPEVIVAEAFFVFIALHVEASVEVVYLFCPSMQLCVEEKPAFLSA